MTPDPRLDFPKESRLRSSAQFQAVFRRGRKLSYPDFSIRYLPSISEGPRLGIAFLKKKSSGRSTVTF